jgi:hypothetical protein
LERSVVHIVIVGKVAWIGNFAELSHAPSHSVLTSSAIKAIFWCRPNSRRNRLFRRFSAIVFLVSSADWVIGAPVLFSDDFVTPATYGVTDISDGYGGGACYGGIAPKYTVFNLFTFNLFQEEAESGSGALRISNSITGFVDPPFGQVEVAALGWVGLNSCGMLNPFEPPLHTSTMNFTNDDLCIYGGYSFSNWHLRTGVAAGTVFGADDMPGLAGSDDDSNGTTDNAEEYPGEGPDGAPGIAGVDDDGVFGTDDLGERGFAGSDDSDDEQGTMASLVVIRGDLDTDSALWIHIEPGTPTLQFALREIVSASVFDVELTDEIAADFYQAYTRYNYMFCGEGSCYGAQLWVGDNMANPVETLGPVVIAGHPGSMSPLAGLGILATGIGASATIDAWIFQGNQNFADKFWVGEGGLLPPVPQDADMDGDVDGVDFAVFASCFNKAGNPPRTLGCDSNQANQMDSDKDGDVDGVDFSVFASCFNKAGNPPRVLGCIPVVAGCGP